MTPPTTLQRLLDRLERLIWEAQDARLTAAGFRVTRIGRWRRSYHRPFRALRPYQPPAATGRGPATPRAPTPPEEALPVGALP